MKAGKLTALLLGASLMAPLAAQADGHQVEKALILVNSGSLQTQGMAMVLGNAMQQQGTQVDVLLCDKAGDLALSETANEPLKPRDVTPEQLLMKLQKGGANVNVCALYLPNGGHDKAALREGVGVATPPAIAKQMTSEETRVFSF